MFRANCKAEVPTDEEAPQIRRPDFWGMTEPVGLGMPRHTMRAINEVAIAIGNTDPSSKDMSSGILVVAMSRRMV
jgi:hypothetical protein